MRMKSLNLHISDDHLSSIAFIHSELETFCYIIAEGVHCPSIAFYKLTGDFELCQADAAKKANEIKEKYVAVQNRINFLKGMAAVELAEENPLTRKELVDILTTRLRDEDTLNRDIPVLANQVKEMMGWNAPIEVNHRSEVSLILESISQNSNFLPGEKLVHESPPPLLPQNI